jgi:hypothetical protein
LLHSHAKTVVSGTNLSKRMTSGLGRRQLTAQNQSRGEQKTSSTPEDARTEGGGSTNPLTSRHAAKHVTISPEHYRKVQQKAFEWNVSMKKYLEELIDDAN